MILLNSHHPILGHTGLRLAKDTKKWRRCFSASRLLLEKFSFWPLRVSQTAV